MTIEQLQRLHSTRPFRPFTIHLADGRSISVDHPELLARTPGGRTFAVGLADNTIEIVDLLLVVSLSEHPNGRPRRGRNRTD